MRMALLLVEERSLCSRLQFRKEQWGSGDALRDQTLTKVLFAGLRGWTVMGQTVE